MLQKHKVDIMVFLLPHIEGPSSIILRSNITDYEQENIAFIIFLQYVYLKLIITIYIVIY